MKNLLILFILFIGTLSYGQKEIKMPELNTNNKVYTLKFSPDSKNKDIISAYAKGTTEKDSIRILANGTILSQRVMVTVLTPDKNAQIKIDIVKDHWEDSQRSGYTENGVFQQAFSTANKFGIVITSQQEDIEFHLAVWTTGENIPNMGSLYQPTAFTEPLNGQSANSAKGFTHDLTNNNSLIYITIGALITIAFLLLVLVLRKKSKKVLSLLFFLLVGSHFAIADIKPTNSATFNAVHYVMENASSMNDWFQKARNVATAIEDSLSPQDRESVPDVNPLGGPQLPSSCIPRRYGGTQGEDNETQNSSPSDDSNKRAGCACLDQAYEDLDRRRLDLERLRIIYYLAMKKIRASIAFGDNVSGVHGVSGLAWQSQKIIILKESIPKLNNSYDNKYREMISALEENLREIEACEATLGNENWYNHSGFIYYQFMADKYKRN